MMHVTLPFAVERGEGVHHLGQERTLGKRVSVHLSNVPERISQVANTGKLLLTM